MSDVIAPTSTVTFTVRKTPDAPADRKTIQRLMRMQPHIQKGLKALQKGRRKDNRTYIRAGVPWTDRVKATRLTRVEEGAQFTLFITPQIVADLRSVEHYLDAKKA
jgi:hypothetical protein